MLRMMEALKTVVCGSHGAGYKTELSDHRSSIIVRERVHTRPRGRV